MHWVCSEDCLRHEKHCTCLDKVIYYYANVDIKNWLSIALWEKYRIMEDVSLVLSELLCLNLHFTTCIKFQLSSFHCLYSEFLTSLAHTKGLWNQLKTNRTKHTVCFRKGLITFLACITPYKSDSEFWLCKPMIFLQITLLNDIDSMVTEYFYFCFISLK